MSYLHRRLNTTKNQPWIQLQQTMCIAHLLQIFSIFILSLPNSIALLSTSPPFSSLGCLGLKSSQGHHMNCPKITFLSPSFFTKILSSILCIVMVMTGMDATQSSHTNLSQDFKPWMQVKLIVLQQKIKKNKKNHMHSTIL